MIGSLGDKTDGVPGCMSRLALFLCGTSDWDFLNDRFRYSRHGPSLLLFSANGCDGKRAGWDMSVCGGDVAALRIGRECGNSRGLLAEAG